jgi:hypothetical protein
VFIALASASSGKGDAPDRRHRVSPCRPHFLPRLNRAIDVPANKTSFSIENGKARRLIIGSPDFDLIRAGL